MQAQSSRVSINFVEQPKKFPAPSPDYQVLEELTPHTPKTDGVAETFKCLPPPRTREYFRSNEHEGVDFGGFP